MITSKQYYNLRKKVEKRITNIERRGYFSPGVLQFKLSGWDTNYIPKGIEREQQIKQLNYFLSNKTTTVLGAKRLEKNSLVIQKIKDSPNAENLFDIYNSLINENLLYEKFKYKIFEDINNFIDLNVDLEEIEKVIKDKYYTGVEILDEEFKIQTTF